METSHILELIGAYLQSHITGSDLVRRIDDLIGDGAVQNLPKDVRKLLSSFQDDLAHYVRDEQTRREAPEVYFTDGELREKAKHFLDELKRLTS